MVQSLLFHNQKFQASSPPLWLYSLVCIGNPEDRFSHDVAQVNLTLNVSGRLNTSLGTLRMLINGKSFLIPLIDSHIIDTSVDDEAA